MKTVVNSYNVCHLFNSRNQETAKTPNRNLEFNGDTITSYRHYPIGKFHKVKTGLVLLIVQNTYSATTAKQIKCLRNATSNRKSFTVQSVDVGICHWDKHDYIAANHPDKPRRCYQDKLSSGHLINLESWLHDAKSDLEKSGRSLVANQNALAGFAIGTIGVFVDYVNTFQLKSKLNRPMRRLYNGFTKLENRNDILDFLLSYFGIDSEKWFERLERLTKSAQLKEYNKVQEKELLVRSTEFQLNADRRATDKMKNKPLTINNWDLMSESDKVNRWRDGKPKPLGQFWNACYPSSDYSIGTGYNFQRIRIKPGSVDELETSKQVSISTREFKLLFSLFHDIRSKRLLPELANQLIESIKTRRVSGLFRIDSINIESGIVEIGCHCFEYHELANMANRLGMFASTDWATDTRQFLPDYSNR